MWSQHEVQLHVLARCVRLESCLHGGWHRSRQRRGPRPDIAAGQLLVDCCPKLPSDRNAVDSKLTAASPVQAPGN